MVAAGLIAATSKVVLGWGWSRGWREAGGAVDVEVDRRWCFVLVKSTQRVGAGVAFDVLNV